MANHLRYLLIIHFATRVKYLQCIRFSLYRNVIFFHQLYPLSFKSLSAWFGNFRQIDSCNVYQLQNIWRSSESNFFLKASLSTDYRKALLLGEPY